MRRTSCSARLDATATAIDLTAPLPMQVARGSMVSDDAGARRATLLFPQGTQASFRLADGTTQPAPTPLTIRQTEYTVGATGVLAMPAGLPPASAYTYNVELSADEERAAGAIGVVFNQPVIFYVENFIGFPVGEHAPAGFYDPQASAWKGEPDGRVVEVVAIAAGAAALDTDGDGSADNGIGTGIAGADLGITLAERQQLATLYAVGQDAVARHHHALQSAGPQLGRRPDAAGGDSARRTGSAAEPQR